MVTKKNKEEKKFESIIDKRDEELAVSEGDAKELQELTADKELLKLSQRQLNIVEALRSLHEMFRNKQDNIVLWFFENGCYKHGVNSKFSDMCSKEIMELNKKIGETENKKLKEVYELALKVKNDYIDCLFKYQEFKEKLVLLDMDIKQAVINHTV